MLKIIKQKIVRKLFWLPQNLLDLISKETKKDNWKNDSALMTHIITNWFQK